MDQEARCAMHELENLLAMRFIERRDVKAWQQPDGAYYPDETPITRADLRSHLSGERSMGHYVVDKETGKARILCYDFDLAKSAVIAGTDVKPREIWADTTHPLRGELVKQLANLAHGMARFVHRMLDVPVAVSYSGSKGFHLYAFVGSEPAGEIRTVGLGLLEQLGCFVSVDGRANTYRHVDEYQAVEFEVFPKHDDLKGKRLGYLLRLPLGINRKGGASSFIRFDASDPTKISKADAVATLTGELPW